MQRVHLSPFVLLSFRSAGRDGLLSPLPALLVLPTGADAQLVNLVTLERQRQDLPWVTFIYVGRYNMARQQGLEEFTVVRKLNRVSNTWSNGSSIVLGERGLWKIGCGRESKTSSTVFWSDDGERVFGTNKENESSRTCTPGRISCPVAGRYRRPKYRCTF